MSSVPGPVRTFLLALLRQAVPVDGVIWLHAVPAISESAAAAPSSNDERADGPPSSAAERPLARLPFP